MTVVHFLVLIAGVTAGFYVNTIVGFSAALVSFPFFLLVMNIRDAVGLESIFYLLSSIILTFKNYKLINRKVVGELAIGIVIGLIAGIKLLKSGDPIILKKIFGVFVLIMVAYLYFHNRKNKHFKRLGILFGFAGGFFSGLFATGGPPVVAYIYNKIDENSVMRASIIGALGVINMIKAPMLIYSGIINLPLLLLALCLMPFFILAIILGHRTYNKINEEVFRNILLLLLMASGISIIIL